jgi:hypothetical protein
MWFKLTLAKDGAIRSCEEVSASFEDSATVVYIEAVSREKAIEKARKDWKKRYRTRVYHERGALGVCASCNQAALPGSAHCATHKARVRASYERTQEKRRALGLKPGEKMPPELHAQRNANAPTRKAIAERNYGGQPSGLLNLRTLLVVQANFRDMSAAKFDAWLQAQIDEYRETQRKGEVAA